MLYMYIILYLGQDSSNHIGPLKTLPPECFVCIYWEILTKASSETYEWTLLKISLICTVPNAHISSWLYKMCQMVATFFCVKILLKQNCSASTNPLLFDFCL